jgi:acyl phosphate:glycerol-3-phosphate acyltransferase
MTQETAVWGVLIGSYLLGSLPFGLWVAHYWKGVDIRTLGSGNIGSTNVGRICGPVAGGVVFAFDVLKGLLPPFVAQYFGLASHWHVLAAFLAIIGHNYSIWLGFKGGKGIATSLGALLGVAPAVGGIAFAIFLLEYVTVRYVSLGSLLAAVSLPFLMSVFYPNDKYRLCFGLVACVMAFYKHRANIQRLRTGTEPKVSMPWQKSKQMPQQEPVSAVVTVPNSAENPASAGSSPRNESNSVHG